MELLTGTDAANQLAGKESVDDVDRVFDAFMSGGQVPGYLTDTSSWPTITITGGGHTLSGPVAPDYWAVGTSDDPLRAGKTSQFFAQRVADKYDAILPSQKLLSIIECQADVMIPYIPVQKDGKADDSTAAVIKANTLANNAIAAKGASNTDGKLKVSGYRKAYVTRPNMNGDYLAIYGGRWTVPCGVRVQPTSGHAHTTGQISGTPNYADASHGLVLVGRQWTLDGNAVDLRDDVFLSKDPTVVALVSDEGRFDPVFPNAGASAVTKMAYADLGGDISTPEGQAIAASKAVNGTGMVLGAIVGTAFAAVLSFPGLAVIGSGLVGGFLGRMIGGTLAPKAVT